MDVHLANSLCWTFWSSALSISFSEPRHQGLDNWQPFFSYVLSKQMLIQRYWHLGVVDYSDCLWMHKLTYLLFLFQTVLTLTSLRTWDKKIPANLLCILNNWDPVWLSPFLWNVFVAIRNLYEQTSSSCSIFIGWVTLVLWIVTFWALGFQPTALNGKSAVDFIYYLITCLFEHALCVLIGWSKADGKWTLARLTLTYRVASNLVEVKQLIYAQLKSAVMI